MHHLLQEGTPPVKTNLIRPHAVRATSSEMCEGYLNNRQEAERIIRENVAHLLRIGTPRSIVIDYLSMAGGDIGILDDLPGDDESSPEETSLPTDSATPRDADGRFASQAPH